MTSPISTALERSLKKFKDEFSDKQKQFDAANVQTVNDALQEVQAKLGRDGKLCNFARIGSFLRAMEHLEKLVTIFLNVHEVVAFVWVSPLMRDLDEALMLTASRSLWASEKLAPCSLFPSASLLAICILSLTGFRDP